MTAADDLLRVSVVVPTYNRAHLLEGALRSVAAQAPARPAEVIVVDDGSSDSTRDVAVAFGARVLRHDVNRGAAAARNTGLRAASHEWVALLDSDDEWLPHHLDVLWGLRDEHVVVAASALRCGSNPLEDRLHGPPTNAPVVLSTPDAVVFPENFLDASAVMVRAAAVIEVDGFDETLRYSEDLDLWIRLLEHGTAVCSPAVTCLWHLHEEQKSRHAAPIQRTIVLSYADRPWCSKALLQRRLTVYEWDAFRIALKARDRAQCLRHIGWIASRPVRACALVRLWTWRLRVRRASGRIARDGFASIAVLPGAAPYRTAARSLVGGRPFVDLGRLRMSGALRYLVRRPAAVVVVGSSLHRAIAWATRATPMAVGPQTTR